MTPGCKRLVVNSKMNECIEISGRTHRQQWMPWKITEVPPWEGELRPWGSRKDFTFVIDPLVLSKFVTCVCLTFLKKNTLLRPSAPHKL